MFLHFISNGFLTFCKKIYSSHFVTFFPLSFTINQPKDFNNKSQITSLKLEEFTKTVLYACIGLILITKLAHHVRGGKHFKKRFSLSFTVKHNTIRYLWPVVLFHVSCLQGVRIGNFLKPCLHYCKTIELS